jgi:hypothetical protein
MALAKVPPHARAAAAARGHRFAAYPRCSADVAAVAGSVAGTVRGVARRLAVLIVLIAVGVPVAAITTLALLPLWSLIESRFGIESVGHSGPADWCFETVYVGWLILAGLTWFALARQARRQRSVGAKLGGRR